MVKASGDAPGHPAPPEESHTPERPGSPGEPAPPERAVRPVRVRVFVEGRVQGVGFRQSTAREAMRLGLQGWVRNLPDGRVEAVYEGPRDAVEKMLAWSGRGPGWAASPASPSTTRSRKGSGASASAEAPLKRGAAGSAGGDPNPVLLEVRCGGHVRDRRIGPSS